jgi:glycerol-3-phosphate cytidylyltransferase-like family protein
MDTRSKILTLEAAMQLPRENLTLAIGHFDALHAAHLRELEVLMHPLLVAVVPLDDELMPQTARAEMVAALRMVDYVLIPKERDLDALINRLAPRTVVRLEAMHTARVRRLIEHVHGRQTR